MQNERIFAFLEENMSCMGSLTANIQIYQKTHMLCVPFISKEKENVLSLFE